MSTWGKVKDAITSAQETGMTVRRVDLGSEIRRVVLKEIYEETGFSVGAHDEFYWRGITFYSSRSNGAACVVIEGDHVHRWAA